MLTTRENLNSPQPPSSALRVLLRSLHVLFNFAAGSCLFPVRLPTLNRSSGSHAGHTCIAQTAGASAPRPAQNPLPAPVDEPHLPDPPGTTAEPPALQLLPRSAPPSCPQLLPTWSRTSDVAADWPCVFARSRPKEAPLGENKPAFASGPVSVVTRFTEADCPTRRSGGLIVIRNLQ